MSSAAIAPEPVRPAVSPLLRWAGPVAALVALLLTAATAGSFAVLAVALVLPQVALAWGAVTITGARAPGLLVVVACGVLVAADLDLGLRSTDGLSALAGWVGVAFVLLVAATLARRVRTGVSESLAGAATGLVFGACGTVVLALHGRAGARPAVVVVLLATASAFAVAGLLDLARPVPAITPGVPRGWPGFIAGLAAAAGIGALYGAQVAPLTTGGGAALGAVAGLVALTLGLGAAFGGTAAAGSQVPTREALAVAVTLPVLAVGPVAYVGATLLLR